MCLSVFFGAHAHGDWCEAMHWCACLYVLMPEAHAHGDCCEAMHACVGVCVLACTRRMATVIAARRCMHVLECVLGLVQGLCQHCHSWKVCMCQCMNKAYALPGDACMSVCVCA
jgi:hypothetical protein